VNWEKLSRAFVHPLRIRILEAIEASEVPLSATNLLSLSDASLGVTSYHVNALAKVGVIEFSHGKQRRGALEKFYRAVSK